MPYSTLPGRVVAPGRPPMPSPSLPRMGGQPPMAGQFNEEGLPGAAGVSQMRPVGQRYFGMMKKGGRVKKTGLYKLHKGEHVIPLSRLMKA